MIPELSYLTWSVVLLIVHIAVQAGFGTVSLGLGYALGSQDEERMPDSTVAKRLERSLMNFLETYPAFIALALLLAITEKATPGSAMGAALWFWARVAYVPVYAFGIPVIRTIVWAISLVGLLLMLWPMLLG